MLTPFALPLHTDPAPHIGAGIGVLFGAVDKAARLNLSGFFVAIVLPVMGGRARGAERLAVAPTVRQLLLRSPTRLASVERFKTGTGAQA